MGSHRMSTDNIFVKNLDKAIDEKALRDVFSSFGTITSCKVATDLGGQSKGHGYVQYDNVESAQNAIDRLNGTLISDKQVYVAPFLAKHERESTSSTDQTRFSNVFVKNLSESTTDEDLKNCFGKYGTITSAVLMRDEAGKSKCFGFVNYENADDAAKAVEALNGKKVDGKELYVGKAQKKSEREQRTERENLFIKYLDDSIGDEKLKELFSGFGSITSCKVMREPNGISKGFGFVAFSTSEEASRALDEMNGKIIISKPLFVALAQKKEERRESLQAQFSQVRPVAIAPSVAPPQMPIYAHGAPAGLGQHFLYGQAPLALIPPQAGFGYQQQLYVPGMWRGGAPTTNFYVPMVQQGQQHGQRPPGGRHRTGPVQQTQQPLMQQQQQQMFPWGVPVYRYPPPGRNMADVPMPAGVVGVPMRQPMPVQALGTALVSATPEQQRKMLGEALYPLVDQLEHDSAGKVTGMLLEMDQTEVLHLLESPEALKLKVSEAMEVLRNAA